MAQNYISRGEVITLKAGESYESGKPYSLFGFCGVALISVSQGEQLSFQLEGVEIGDLIYITVDHQLAVKDGRFNVVFGRAVTDSDEKNLFYCRIKNN